MAPKEVRLGDSSSANGRSRGSPIARALSESIDFRYQILGKRKRNRRPGNNGLTNQWYALMSDGRSVEGIVDSAKDLVEISYSKDSLESSTHWGHEPGMAAHSDKTELRVLRKELDTVMGTKSNKSSLAELDELSAGERASLRRRLVKRSAYLYTKQGEILEIIDSEVVYIDVLSYIDDDLLSRYWEVRALSEEARNRVLALHRKLGLPAEG